MKMSLLLNLLALALLAYLALAVGVNLIARLAPVPQKPLLNATLLGGIILAFLFALGRMLLTS